MSIEFYKGKSVCKTIVFAAWGLGQSPGGLSGGKDLIFFWLFNVFKVIEWLTVALNKLYDLRSYTSS